MFTRNRKRGLKPCRVYVIVTMDFAGKSLQSLNPTCILLQNDIFTPHLCLAAPQGWPRRNFAKILIYTKLEWMGWRKHDNIFSRFDIVSACDRRTDGQTDGRTDVQPIFITCFSIADARKNIYMHNKRRPQTKGRFPLPEFTARVHGPSWRVSKNAPEFSGRQLGPWTRAVNSGSGNRPLENAWC